MAFEFAQAILENPRIVERERARPKEFEDLTFPGSRASQCERCLQRAGTKTPAREQAVAAGQGQLHLADCGKMTSGGVLLGEAGHDRRLGR